MSEIIGGKPGLTEHAHRHAEIARNEWESLSASKAHRALRDIYDEWFFATNNRQDLKWREAVISPQGEALKDLMSLTPPFLQSAEYLEGSKPEVFVGITYNNRIVVPFGPFEPLRHSGTKKSMDTLYARALPENRIIVGFRHDVYEGDAHRDAQKTEVQFMENEWRGIRAVENTIIRLSRAHPHR